MEVKSRISINDFGNKLYLGVSQYLCPYGQVLRSAYVIMYPMKEMTYKHWGHTGIADNALVAAYALNRLAQEAQYANATQTIPVFTNMQVVIARMDASHDRVAEKCTNDRISLKASDEEMYDASLVFKMSGIKVGKPFRELDKRRVKEAKQLARTMAEETYCATDCKTHSFITDDSEMIWLNQFS